MRRFAATLTGILVVAVLLFGPYALNRSMGRDIYKEWLSGGQREYTGIIRLWHIYAFQTAQANSGAEYLRYCARRFEKRNRGVFVEFVSMTVAEAQERIARGESPDIYSFPLGFMPEGISPAPALPGGLIPGVEKSVAGDRGAIAVPYMMSGYLLLANTQLMGQAFIDEPEEWNEAAITEVATKGTFVKKLGKQQTSYTGLCYEGGVRLSLVAIGDRLPAVNENCVTSEMNEFFQGRAALCVASLGAWGKHEKNYEAGKGFECAAQVAGCWTDMVQYAACRDGLEDGKKEKCEEFILSLADAKHQSELFEYGAFPVLQKTLEDKLNVTVSDDPDGGLAEPMKSLGRALLNPAVPSLETWGQERELVKISLSAALKGDLDARGLLSSLANPFASGAVMW